MDPSSLVLGLVRAMEERFGWLGRPMTTTMLLLLFLGIALWALSMVRQELIEPIMGAVEKGYGPEIASSVVAWTIGLILLIPTFFIVRWVASRFLFAKLDQRMREEKAEFDAWVQSHHEDSNLHFVVTGEDAEKQWPELERRVQAEFQPIIQQIELLEGELEEVKIANPIVLGRHRVGLPSDATHDGQRKSLQEGECLVSELRLMTLRESDEPVPPPDQRIAEVVFRSRRS